MSLVTRIIEADALNKFEEKMDNAIERYNAEDIVDFKYVLQSADEHNKERHIGILIVKS